MSTDRKKTPKTSIVASTQHTCWSERLEISLSKCICCFLFLPWIEYRHVKKNLSEIITQLNTLHHLRKCHPASAEHKGPFCSASCMNLHFFSDHAPVSFITASLWMWPPSQQFANTAEQQCNKSGTKTAAADVWLWHSSKTVKLKLPTWQLISDSFILNS